ncbi:hypothetical protein BDQ17DRAFT_712018 [Cyathus striatus]|nr:hypothetical protein BDQ17DRAFT_712018 [Cyathus striatus]
MSTTIWRCCFQNQNIFRIFSPVAQPLPDVPPTLLHARLNSLMIIMPHIPSFLGGLLSLLLLVAAQDDSSAEDVGFPHDPFLQYRPPFARSLPVQILLTGIVLTLVVVLFIHLVFTAQYHWPLAPVNYVLQISGVTTLLISLIATIHVVLSSAFAESERWPYMLSYIAVNVPPNSMAINQTGALLSAQPG